MGRLYEHGVLLRDGNGENTVPAAFVHYRPDLADAVAAAGGNAGTG